MVRIINRGILYSRAIAFIICLAFSISYLYSTENVSGTITQDTKWLRAKSPYLVTADITIASNAKLTIEPGVTVKYNSGTSLIVQGKLIAKGTIDSVITFTSWRDNNGAQPGDWGGIHLVNIVDSNFVRLSSCNINYGGSSKKMYNSLIFSENSSARIEFCTLSNSQQNGITCAGNLVPDLGGGSKSSFGYNIFSDFNAVTKYAVNNKTALQIYAMLNCWGSANTTLLNRQIFDVNDDASKGQVIFLPLATTCQPTKPSAPTLVCPINKASKITLKSILKWNSSLFAGWYSISIARDSLFKNLVQDIKILSDTSFQAPNLEYSSKYYWRVKAGNSLGISNWSTVFTFSTADTIKPKPVVLINPPDSSRGVLIKGSFDWAGQDDIEKYHIQIALDTLFENVLCNDSIIKTTSIVSSVLTYNTKYYWHVRAKNYNGCGPWSKTFEFKTKITPEPYFDPPLSWQFERLTGENTAIVIAKDINQKSGKRYLEPQDAIGVFYVRDEMLACGGFTVWDDIDNTALTAWGDNKQTQTIKDGFLQKERYRYKLWDAQNGVEKPVSLTLSSGPDSFKPDTISTVKSITELSNQKIRLQAGKWNYISTNIIPYYPFLDSLLEGKKVILRNVNQEIYNQSQSIKDIWIWDNNIGYEAYSSFEDTLDVPGDKINPTDYQFNLTTGEWFLLPFLPDIPMSTDIAFNSIRKSIVFVVSTSGGLYSPKYGVDNIKILVPGEAYKIVCSEPVNYRYPISQSSPEIVKIDLSKSHFITNAIQTGSTSVYVLESDLFENGDEVAILSANNSIIGNSIIQDKRCSLIAWGDNSITSALDGAMPDELLRLVWYNKKNNIENKLAIVTATDLLKNSKLSEIKYKRDAVSLLKVVKSTGTDVDENNNECPILSYQSTVSSKGHIELLLNKNQNMDVQIFDILGKSEGLLYQGRNTAGNVSIDYSLDGFCDGLYIIVLRIGNECYHIKILKISNSI